MRRASPQTDLVPFAALIAGAVAIGFSPILVRLSEAGPVPTAFYRVALAVPVLALTSWRADSRATADSGSWRNDWGLFAAAGAFFAADLASWHWSVKLTTVANSTLLANCAPIFVVLASWLLFGERVGGRFLLGLALSIAGAAALVGNGATLASGNLAGDALAVGTAMAYAGYLMCVGRLRSRHGTQRIMLATTVLTALMLAPLSLVSGEKLFADTLSGWAVLLALALVSQAGGQNLIAYALRQVPVAFSSVALLLQPVVAAALAWMLFAERLGPLQMGGGILVLAGIVICRQASRRAATRPIPG